jgi:predicted RNase H-like HicB family nuclease
MKRFFTLEYWLDDGWFVGKLKEVPGVFSQGETLDELKINIEDAYRLMLQSSEPEIEHPQSHSIELGMEV